MFAKHEKTLQEILGAYPDLGARPQGGMRSNNFTLERMQALMAALDQPQQKYPTIHIAGTNGKGSVSALCAAALQAQGYKTGRFTSPHIQGALHGIAINGKTDDEIELSATFESMRPHLDVGRGWTQFEIVTALALLHFSLAAVDAAVIEVGLGGRLDATNVLTPLVSVITAIDFDHTSILGDSLAQIAKEKAGIVKPGIPVVMSPQQAEVRAVIVTTARERRSQLVEVGKDILFNRGPFDLQGQELRLRRAEDSQELTLRIGLHGAHQIENAATAYAALHAANQHGLRVEETAIQRGFAAARWPGRFEILQNDPPVVLDAAHSPGAARALRQALDDYFPGQAIQLVIGVSADKDLAGLIEPLWDRVQAAIATQSSHPRAMPAAQLQERLVGLGIPAQSEPDAAKALRMVTKTTNADGLILCCGSVFLIEMLRQIYFR